MSIKLKEGQIVKSLSGRKCTPFPGQNQKEIDQWLVWNATESAWAINDLSYKEYFSNLDFKKLNSAQRAECEVYLFGYPK